MYNKEDVLEKDKIKDGLPNFYNELEIFDIIDSTNDYIKKIANIKPEGFVCISDSQSKGKGRNGRIFFSPKQKGIYMSILLKPNLEVFDSLKITACASVAVFDAIKKNYGIEIAIKWINDIYYQDFKIGGILCESELEINKTKIEYMIVGIGLNIHKTDFSEELKNIAAPIENFTTSVKSRNDIIKDILIFFNKYYQELNTLSFLPIYKKHSSVLKNYITVYEPSISYEAFVEDINNDASLIIRTENGTIKTLNSGEISIRKKI
jgi:birA, biotin-[acetyl-CoA-carboxylase] ligase region